LKHNPREMFNPQILAASWVEKMVSFYPHVVEGWLIRPDDDPQQKLLTLLDRFIEGTMGRMAGEDRTDPDRWGAAMMDVLEAELGEPRELDPRQSSLEERMYWQEVRGVLNGMVDHYFTADWERAGETEDLP
jgi:hypothetical protein